MLDLPENFTILAIGAIALIILIWGYNRGKQLGEIGILAWLQSVTLMTPWLLFFILLATGIYINFIGVIFLLLTSTGVYIYLGRQIRKKAIEQNLSSVNLNNNILKSEKENPENSNSEEEKNNQEESSLQNPIPEINFTPIDEQDIETIKGIFNIDTFFSTETIPYQEGAIFKGNLRTEPEIAHQKLSEKLEEKLGDKYRLFLVETPDGKPVVIILPSSNDPKPLTLVQKNLALVLFVATAFTSIEAISVLLGFDLIDNWSRYPESLPLTLGLWLILFVHEMGHRIMAEKHNIKVSLPFFLPNIQIGTFGAITRFESLIPNRSVLFDIAFAGPALGGGLSLIMLFFGLVMSGGNTGLQIPSLFFQGSILVGGLAKLILGSTLSQATIAIHPLMILGWLGLVITALNCLPAGQLDGGRIIQAIYGRKIARRATILTLIVLGIVSLFNTVNSLPFYWAIVILFLQRDLERPSLNELTEPDDTRAGWGLLLIFMALITLIPITPSLAIRFGIGI
ncbi:peptidase M50 [Cyanobacterium stanieri PCC 7202]|uniref:Peptidase M50 n=1 Tax=Cyanobacterium stanieri (strain ATCC 29140 / PCC 7202) TaxID=292563 RepID=K9YIK3_CYASC|nr:peptidase M50 [Cyanobacterium stanieri PCC 7202]